MNIKRVGALHPPGANVVSFGMVKTLQRAIAEVEHLPEHDQEKIGRELLAHVEKLRALRADLDAGIRSLDAGAGKPLDVEDVIRRARERHCRG